MCPFRKIKNDVRKENMKIRRFIALTAISLSLIACSNLRQPEEEVTGPINGSVVFGAASLQSFNSSLVVGATTKSDVFTRYGKSDRTSTFEGLNRWEYVSFKCTGHCGRYSQGLLKRAVLNFDKSGVLTGYQTFGDWQ